MMGRTGRLVLACAALVAANPVSGQTLAQKLRAGDAAAFDAAVAALETPDEADVDGLLDLMTRGRRKAGRTGITAELAFAVLGWWSIQDAAIADGIYERFEAGSRQTIMLDLLWLAVIGAADGGGRARRWLARENPHWVAWGWWLVRNVGADRETVDSCVDAALKSGSDSGPQLAAWLIWEFELASEELTQRLEALYAKAADDATRWSVLWSMARSGAFRSEWMLETRRQLVDHDEELWFDRQFEFAVPAVTRRLARELPLLEPGDRAQVACWLASHVHDATLRHSLMALELDPAELRRLFADSLATHALGDRELLGFWVGCLDDDARRKRLACLALAHIGEPATSHLPSIARLLEETGARERLAPADLLRASAIHALGAFGPAAAQYAEKIERLAGANESLVAAAARWALPRLRGEEPMGPWQPPPRPRPEFEPARLLELGSGTSDALRSVPGWKPAHRLLALPRLLVTMLDETPSRPPKRMAIGLGDLPPLELITSTDRMPFMGRTAYLPEEIPWRRLCSLRAEALQSIGQQALAARPLLQWLAPRRPGLADVVATLGR